MKSSPMEEAARKVAARLRDAGHIAYFAGGCVRDMVRGLAPKDYDIATDARPEVVQRIFPRTYAVGAHFGVIIVLENDFQFEVATFRSDEAYIDGRHPTAVHFSSPEEDARRRDVTINGMFYDPVAEEVIDLVGGRADIAAKLVRAIGDPAQRFAEDRLRMLRAVRFAPLHDLAKPRTATVDETGRIRFSGHDRLGAEMTEEIMRRLRFSGAEIEGAVEMVRQHMVFKDVPKMRVAKLKRFMARPTFDDELELHRVDCQGSHRMLDNYEFLVRKREEFANEPIIPPPLVRGDDLIALGLEPSPKFREILEAVETRQLEGSLCTRDEALNWVKLHYSLGVEN